MMMMKPGGRDEETHDSACIVFRQPGESDSGLERDKTVITELMRMRQR